MVQAAKAMAGLGVKALNEPNLIAAARPTSTSAPPAPYVSPLPDNVAPPLHVLT
jgi:aminobenzoyl-glutamate utilization protein B